MKIKRVIWTGFWKFTKFLAWTLVYSLITVGIAVYSHNPIITFFAAYGLVVSVGLVLEWTELRRRRNRLSDVAGAS